MCEKDSCGRGGEGEVEWKMNNEKRINQCV